MRHRLEHTRLLKEWLSKKEESQFLDNKIVDKQQATRAMKEQAIIQQQEQAREIREWNEKRQATQAFNAYEARLIMIGRYEEQQLS